MPASTSSLPRLASPRWPGNAQCVVLVTVNFDAESVDLTETREVNLYGRYSSGRYGMRAGLARLLEAFANTGTKATVFVPATDAQRHPEALDAVLKGGHEVGARGYAFEDHGSLGEAEFETLQRAHEALTAATGSAPVGWRAPRGLLSPATLGHLARLGYLYDASFEDDDWPYIVQAEGGRRLVELPQFQPMQDATFYEPRHSHVRVLKTWKEEFDAMHAEGTLVTLTLHPRGDYGSGRAARARVVEDFLGYMAARPGTRFMTCRELATWWLANQTGTLEGMPPG
jgi:peptidoglycan/xylan/chitin deacetylase (PgdA/CDA1 family)